MKTDNFHLEIIPVEKIVFHEEFDATRSDNLLRKIKHSGIFTDPIIVASLGDNQYLQLDGMNRLNCFKKLGLKTILAQIVDYNNQDEVKLSSWIHIFKAKKEEFFKYIESKKGLILKKAQIKEINPRYIKEKGFGRLLTIIDKKTGAYLIYTNGNLSEKIKKMCYIVSFYKDDINRTTLPFILNSINIRLFFYEYPQLNFYNHPDANFMIVFPNFTPQQIIEVVEDGGLFPPGVTRHLIKYRCLNINLPLNFFNNSKSLKQLNKELDLYLSKKNIRVYEESVINFE